MGDERVHPGTGAYLGLLGEFLRGCGAGLIG